MRYLGAFGSHREPWPEDELRAAWADLGDEITAEVRAAQPCRRPWAWWRLVLNIEMPLRASEQRETLLRLGYLDDEERRILEQNPSLTLPTGQWYSDRWPPLAHSRKAG